MSDLLLRIVCRVREDAREKTTDNPINTLHNDPVFVCVLKLGVAEEDRFCSMKQLVVAVCEEGSRWRFVECLLYNLLNLVWHL